MQTSDTVTYPMRVNRYLAQKGIATRRAADDLIRKGLVKIDGKVATLGDRVLSPEARIDVDSRQLPERRYLYFAYNKPRGVITHSPQTGERDIRAVSDVPDVFPVGRLDKDSEGLMILTNDGRVTERLLHPRFEHEKEYHVTVRETITSKALAILAAGVLSEGDRLTAKKIIPEGAHTLVIVLTQGKKHQIRRMLDAAHLTVTRLVRTRIMDIHLGGLRTGATRALTGRARNAWLLSLGLK